MAALAGLDETDSPVVSPNGNPSLSNSDHTYSSPTLRPIPGYSPPVKPTSNHTYAENSDVPTEPYGSDNENKIYNVSTGITSEGRLIVASTDKLEISVEYSTSATLLEATGTSQNASEMLLDASNAGMVWPGLEISTDSPLSDETTDHEALLEATNVAEQQQNCVLPDETPVIVPDETTKPVSPSGEIDSVPPEATDMASEPKLLLPDETLNMLPDELPTPMKGSEVVLHDETETARPEATEHVAEHTDPNVQTESENNESSTKNTKEKGSDSPVESDKSQQIMVRSKKLMMQTWNLQSYHKLKMETKVFKRV